MNERTRISSGLGRLEELEPPPTVPYGKAYRSAKGCTVLVSRDPARAAPPGLWLPRSALELWHLSVSHRRRYPTWDEIADARYLLIPDEVTMAMLLPPPGDYVNVNEHAFHLWEIPDPRGGQ